MEKTVRMNMLFDFYGPLLTERQRDVYELYFGDDLSLSEIASELEISRQAVYDMLKRCSATLEDYESKLGLLQKFAVQRNVITSVDNKLVAVKETLLELGLVNQVAIISKLKEQITELLTE